MRGASRADWRRDAYHGKPRRWALTPEPGDLATPPAWPPTLCLHTASTLPPHCLHTASTTHTARTPPAQPPHHPRTAHALPTHAHPMHAHPPHTHPTHAPHAPRGQGMTLVYALVVAITNGSDDHTPDHHSSSDAQHTGPSIGWLQPPAHAPLSPSPQPARSAQPSSLRSTYGVVISLVAEPHLGRYGLGGPDQWPTPFDTIRHPIETPALLACRRARRGQHRRRHRRTASPVRTLTPATHH